MAKIINKGLAKSNSKMLLSSSLIGPIMKYPKKKHKKRNKNK